MPSRRSVIVALLAVVLAVLLLWWQRSDRGDGAVADGLAGAAPGDERTRAEPIGAVIEPAERHSRLPWNRPGASISGRVTDEAGTPIAQADVCVVLGSWSLPDALRRAPRCSKSAADGRYSLAGIPPLRVGVLASAATFIPGRYDPPGAHDYFELRAGQAAKDVDVVLHSGGVEIHGVVKDIAGGVIEGAVVSSGAAMWGRAPTSLSLTHSDEHGAFSLWVASGEIDVLASADGYAGGSESGAAPGYTFEILLTPESVLAGRVVRVSDGKPVADAYVTLDDFFSSRHGTYTDDEGRFRIDQLEPGRYKPLARARSGRGQIAQSVRLGLGETIDGIVIEMHPMASVRGTVVIEGDAQTPCENGSVSLTGNTTKHREVGPTDHTGAIEIVALPLDVYDVVVSCAGYVAMAEYPQILVTEQPSETMVWEVKPGLSIEGIVVDPDGRPVVGADVGAEPFGAAARAQQTSACCDHTGVDGGFELRGLLPGDYELQAYRADLLPPKTSPKLSIGEGEPIPAQRLVLELGGSVHGRVLDSQHRGVAGAHVEVMGDDWNGGSARTTDDGSFVVAAVRPGAVRVVARRGGSDDMRAPGTNDDDVQGERVQVTAGTVATVQLLVEEQFGTIIGKVVDADGEPVHDAFVHSARESDSAASNVESSHAQVRWSEWHATPSLTEQDGSFSLGELEPGKHTLMAMRRGGGEGVVEHIATGATGVVITLGEGGTIAGKVVLASGDAPRRFEITAHDPGQGLHHNEKFFETAGSWRLDDLPAGTYSVGVVAAEGSAVTEVELADGAERSGITLTLTGRTDVSGTVVDVDTGAPVSGVRIAISSRSGDGSGYASRGDAKREYVTDDTGGFVVRGAPAGPVRVQVAPGSFSDSEDVSYGWSTISARIPADTASFELPPIRIAKSRTKRGDRSGDFGITLKQGAPEAEDHDVPLEIAVIRPGSPAAASKLKLGDIIVEVDGKDVTGANKYLYDALTQVKEGDAVSFSVKDGGSVTLVAGKPI